MKLLILMALAIVVTSCGTKNYPMTMTADTMRVPVENVERFETEVTRAIAMLEQEHNGEVAVSLIDDSIDYQYRGNELFHAASTMKVPVMITVYRMAEAGEISLEDEIEIRTEFNSFVDGAPFTVEPRDYVRERIGETASVRDLVREMIQVSDNVATNLLLELVTPARVTRVMRELGADDGYVIRALQDTTAYRFDLSNRISANDLSVLARSIQLNEAASSISCAEMRQILGGQRFRSMIPAGLPRGTDVYNKTGSITGHRHDTAIVSTHIGNYYLTILTRGNDDNAIPTEKIAELSDKIYTEWSFLRE